VVARYLNAVSETSHSSKHPAAAVPQEKKKIDFKIQRRYAEIEKLQVRRDKW